MKFILCCDEVMIKMDANIPLSAQSWQSENRRKIDGNGGRRQTDDSGETILIWKWCDAHTGSGMRHRFIYFPL